MVKIDRAVYCCCFCSSYEFDVTKCMFSFGNITEKLRVARFDCRGDTVVDLYAGVDTFYILVFIIRYCLITGKVLM